MKMRRTMLAASIAAIGAFSAGMFVTTASRAGILDYFHRNTASGTAAAAPTQVAAAAATPRSYRETVEQYGPAVVGITVQGERKIAAADDGTSPAPDDPFFQFFRGLPGFRMQPPGEAVQPFRGLGSGFIVSTDGLVLTNAHVVRDAREVTVKLADRREFTAKVLGSDPVTDVAVLRIPADHLATVRIGDPKTLRVGDPVLAIGAPFGFDESATAGIVSAKGRSLPGDSTVPFIQTDAAVNPGNSGGPLFDADGNVVGINAQIYSQTGGYQGLSFAIPIDVALRAKDQIVASGHASHARLGVEVQDLTQDLASAFGLQRPDGALVSNVAPESAAASAGLKSGDVIVRIGDETIAGAGDLSQRIGASAPGDHVSLQVWRDHAMKQFDVKLGTAGAEQVADEGSGAGEGSGLGLALRPMSPDERASASLDHGLVVEQARGAAARAGIRPGDVVVGVDGRPATSVAQLREIVGQHPKAVALLVERDGQQLFVPVKLG